MKRPFQPIWASEEEKMLAEEWANGDSELTIDKYIYEHASKRLRDEYNRQKRAMNGMRFGRKVLPDGDMIIYN